MNEEIKRLYEEANRLHLQAKGILEEFKGQEMPAEKESEVDKLLDQVEAKSQAAKRLERAEESRKLLAEPVEQKLFSQPALESTVKAKVVMGGRELDADEIAELKSIAPFKAYIGAESQDYAKAFRAMHRKPLRDLPEELRKALSVGDGPAGGYLVQDQYFNGLVVKAREMSAMLRICNVLPPVPSGSVIVPTEDSIFTDFAWTSEVGTGSEDTVQPFGQRRLSPHPLAKRVKVSNTFLRNPVFDAETYVRDRLGYKHGGSLENGLINGTGNQQPLGIANTTGLTVFTTASSTAVYGNDIINWVYTLPASYAARARILCNRALIRKIRTLAKPDAATSFTNYIWQPALAAGQPATILDVPYELTDRLDDGLSAADAWEANAVVAYIGAWEHYWVVPAMTFAVQRLVELYAETNQTGFIGRGEWDGMCVLPEAFVGLKIKA